MHATAQMPPPNRTPQPADYQSGRIRMKDGSLLEWGRCRYVIEANPLGLILMVIARDTMKGRGVDDRFLCPWDAVACAEFQASALTGLVS